MDILSYIIGRSSAKGGGGAEEVETSVALDFSNGDMEVTPNEGEAFSKVTIPKPETLVAGNIAEGINIAGIIGTFAGGGGGGNFRYVADSFTATTSEQTITHEIGEVPDIIIVATQEIPEHSKIFFAVGYSQAMLDSLGGGSKNRITFLTSSGSAVTASGNEGIENSAAGTYYEQYGGIRSFTSTTFKMGGTSYGLQSCKYSYIAICGIV